MNTPTDQVIAATRAWVNHAVIGLNLCPFAKAVEVRDLIRYVVSDATDPDALLAVLDAELRFLAEADPAVVETTLLIHPAVFDDFLEFNQFLGDAEGRVLELKLTGVLQVASFHPRYQFAGTDADDVTNATNRSPYPTLHLLREESIERALESFPDPDSIYEANVETLRRIGRAGWKHLQSKWTGSQNEADGSGAGPTPPQA